MKVKMKLCQVFFGCSLLFILSSCNPDEIEQAAPVLNGS